MSVSNKKNKADDNEILETFFRVFFYRYQSSRGNWKHSKQDCFYLFLFVLFFFFFKCTCSDLDHTFSEHNLIHRTEIFKQLILNGKFLDDQGR